MFYGFGQRYNVIYPPLQYHTEYRFSDGKSPVPHLFVPLPPPKYLATTDLFIVCILLPFPEGHIVGII